MILATALVILLATVMRLGVRFNRTAAHLPNIGPGSAGRSSSGTGSWVAITPYRKDGHRWR